MSESNLPGEERPTLENLIRDLGVNPDEVRIAAEAVIAAREEAGYAELARDPERVAAVADRARRLRRIQKYGAKRSEEVRPAHLSDGDVIPVSEQSSVPPIDWDF